MATAGRLPALIDTSVLINFLKIDGVDLLARHPHYQFIVTDHVAGELKDYYPEQQV